MDYKTRFDRLGIKTRGEQVGCLVEYLSGWFLSVVLACVVAFMAWHAGMVDIITWYY